MSAVRVKPQAKASPESLPPAEALLTLPMPPSANQYWRPIAFKGRAMMGVTNEARKYKRVVKERLESWVYLPYTRADKLRVAIYAYPANLRGDVTNLPKVLLDSLEGIVMVNDISVVSMSIDLIAVDKENPRVQITITRLDDYTNVASCIEGSNLRAAHRTTAK